MKPTVCFIHRKSADTPSIERVFSVVEAELKRQGVLASAVQLPFGNSLIGVLCNLAAFRPPPADIYHITGHVHYIALSLSANRTVLTIHDLGVLRNRRGPRLWAVRKLFFDWPLRRTGRITAVSDATEADLIEQTGCPPEKIRVINDPVSPSFVPRELRFNSGQPTILQVGTAPHKNFGRLIDAVTGMSCRLLILGRPGEDMVRKMNELGIEFENPTAETDEQMLEIYARSDIVAFCSTFEGFGLPIVEAQAVGRPVVTSNIPPMSDVAGDAALSVDPTSASDIRQAIESLVENDQLRNQLIDRGFENVKRFKADKIAGQYMELYMNVLGSPPTKPSIP